MECHLIGGTVKGKAEPLPDIPPLRYRIACCSYRNVYYVAWLKRFCDFVIPFIDLWSELPFLYLQHVENSVIFNSLKECNAFLVHFLELVRKLVDCMTFLSDVSRVKCWILRSASINIALFALREYNTRYCMYTLTISTSSVYKASTNTED